MNFIDGIYRSHFQSFSKTLTQSHVKFINLDRRTHEKGHLFLIRQHISFICDKAENIPYITVGRTYHKDITSFFEFAY